MKFDEALAQFENELLKEYGPGASVTKIGLPTELFERVVVDLKTSMRYTAHERINMQMRDVGELHCRGVQILRRDKEAF